MNVSTLQMTMKSNQKCLQLRFSKCYMGNKKTTQQISSQQKAAKMEDNLHCILQRIPKGINMPILCEKLCISIIKCSYSLLLLNSHASSNLF